MKTHNIAGKPVWVAVLLLIATGSLAVGLLSPQLTKSGSLTGTVAERVFITSGTTPGVTPVTSSQALSSSCSTGTAFQGLGGEHFEAQFFVYVGECVGYVIQVANSGLQPTVAALSCTVTSGLIFSATAFGGMGSGVSQGAAGRVGPNTYISYLYPSTQTGVEAGQFNVYFKGLIEGEYSVSCTVGEASNFPVS